MAWMYLAETQPFHSLLCAHFAGASRCFRIDWLHRQHVLEHHAHAAMARQSPRTFGPHRVHQQEVLRSTFQPTLFDTRAAIGTADTPAEPISRFDFVLTAQVQRLRHQHPGRRDTRQSPQQQNA